MKLSDDELVWALREGFIPSLPEQHSERLPEYLVSSSEPCSSYKLQDDIIGQKPYSFTEFDRKLRDTVRATVPADRKVGVMLSGGKDSTALLYALHREGYKNIQCYTYVPNHGEDESSDVKSLCDRLKYDLKLVKADHKKDFLSWDKALTFSDRLSVDFAYPAVCRLHDTMSSDGVTVAIDGMGNDVYMGHVPGKIETFLRRIALVRFFGKALWGKDYLFNRQILPWQGKYILSSLFYHPVESYFPGTRLDSKDIGYLGLSTDSLYCHLEALRDYSKRLSEYDARAFIRGLLFDEFGAMGKTRSAASAFGLEVVFPYSSEEFSDYYSSLKLSDRFNWQDRINKVSLRKYLKELRTIYSIESGVFNERKGSFRFNFDEFLMSNKADVLRILATTDKKYESFTRLIEKYYSKLDYHSASKIYLLYSCVRYQSQRA